MYARDGDKVRFASPPHLGLRLVASPIWRFRINAWPIVGMTPRTRATLGSRPVPGFDLLPSTWHMTIYDTDALTVGEEEDVVIVLGYSVRIHDISLSMSSSLEKLHAKVESSFPAPEQLHPCSPESGEFVVLAGAFLGAGSGGTNTSRLCHLNLGRISFPRFHNSFCLAGTSFPSYLGTNFIVGDGFLSQQALAAALSATRAFH